jgi:hypothetical protein
MAVLRTGDLFSSMEEGRDRTNRSIINKGADGTEQSMQRRVLYKSLTMMEKIGLCT